jgi:hypothetical protein
VSDGMPGDGGPDFEVTLTAEELAHLASTPPTPMDDLCGGIRIFNAALWTKSGIPDDVRDRMRTWIRAAQQMLVYRVEEL